MKTSATLRIAASVAAAAIAGASAVQAAPKKAEPAPAVQKAQEQKPGFFSKVKNALPFVKKRETPAPAKQAPVKKSAPAAVKAAKPAATVKAPAPAKTKEVAKTKVVPAEEKKPGFFKSLFTRASRKEQPESGPKLAKAKTAKPAPVKEKKTELATNEKPKRGFFGFLKNQFTGPLEDQTVSSAVPDDLKIERPKDWEEYHIISDEDVAMYEFGPSQLAGPDARLTPGTLVKIRKQERGWAEIEIQGENKRTGYIDALAMRRAEKTDFNDPPPPPVEMASASSSYLLPWAPLAPPPDLPDQPGTTDTAADALLLLPPLELEPKP